MLTYAPDAAARTGRVGIVGDQQSGDLGETTRSRLPGDRRFPRAVDTAVADNGAVSNEIPLPVARRFLALRHLLAPPRALPGEPESVMAVVDRLGSLQFDPLEVAGRNHDLVLQARDIFQDQVDDRVDHLISQLLPVEAMKRSARASLEPDLSLARGWIEEAFHRDSSISWEKALQRKFSGLVDEHEEEITDLMREHIQRVDFVEEI